MEPGLVHLAGRVSSHRDRERDRHRKDRQRARARAREREREAGRLRQTEGWEGGRTREQQCGSASVVRFLFPSVA